MHLDDFVDEFDSRHDNRRINHHTEAGVQPGGGAFGAFAPPKFSKHSTAISTCAETFKE